MDNPPEADRMVTMNVSLPESLREYAQDRTGGGFGSVSEYVRELIRRDREARELRLSEQAMLRSLSGASIDRGAVREAIEGLRALRDRVSADGRGMSQEEIQRVVDGGSGL